MTTPRSPTFAEAQARLASRRQAREAEHAARLSAQRTRTSAARSRIYNLPAPLRVLGLAGLNAYDGISEGGGLTGTRPAFRVGQVDAELLDDELVEMLRGQVRDAFKYLSGGHLSDDWAPEIALMLRAALFKLSVWDRDATYGASLQNLRYTDARHEGPVPQPPSRWQKTAFGLVTVGGKYIWTKWENWLLDNETALDDDQRPYLRKLANLTDKLTSIHAAAALVSFLVFLRHGRYRTILDRLLRMRLAPATDQVNRIVSLEYLNRQLVWHAFTEFLLFLLPLVGINRWRRWLSRTWRKTKDLVSTSGTEDDGEKKGEYAFLPERTCAICYQDQNAATTENEVMAAAASSSGVVGSAATDITNPYETVPCGCIYCYVCLAKRIEQEEGEGWTCLRCGELVKECQAWNGDVLEQSHKSHSQKTVEFSDKIKTIPAEMYSPTPDDSRAGEDVGGEAELVGDDLLRDEEPRPQESRSSSSDTDSEIYEEEEDGIGEDLGEEE